MYDPIELSPLKLEVEIEAWPLRVPFKITGWTFENIDVVVVTLRYSGYSGRGEATGVYYKGETAQTIAAEIEEVRPVVQAGIDRARLQALLPAGGARNALDCALWDLEAKVRAVPAWKLAGLDAAPKPTITTFTCGAGTPDEMAQAACDYPDGAALKLKLTGEILDLERVRAVREARPAAWIGVDANQGLDLESCNRLLPVIEEARVQLIEQPFPIGSDALWDEFSTDIPCAADESMQGLDDLQKMVGRYEVVNIKLDKCGGLTEGLAIAREARVQGLRPMIGNMLGTSLAMAPAYLLAQVCEFVDLDGPTLLARDRGKSACYEGGKIACVAEIWGGSAS